MRVRTGERNSGAPLLPPATPDMRVRIRRFEGLSSIGKSRDSQLVEIADGESGVDQLGSTIPPARVGVKVGAMLQDYPNLDTCCFGLIQRMDQFTRFGVAPHENGLAGECDSVDQDRSAFRYYS
jgi:hypothetical protein